MRMKKHAIFDCDDHGKPAAQLAFVTPAKPADVLEVMMLPPKGHDARSKWMWVRLRDGTLILGVFPQGGTYDISSDLAPYECVDVPS